MTNFTAYNDRVAIVGTDFGTAYITHPRDVAGYAAQHAELSGLAVWGEDAAREVDRIGVDYRSMT